MVEGNGQDAVVPVMYQSEGRALHPKPLDEAEERLAADGPEDPVEVKGRERGHAREPIEGQVFGQVGRDVINHSIDALLVIQAVEVGGAGHRVRCDLPIFRTRGP